jgi:dipeptidyl aminopeptidase/acylaminoacyl peptidase
MIIKVLFAWGQSDNSKTLGTWTGYVELPGKQRFEIAIEFIENGNQSKVFFHSIAQKSYNIPVRRIIQTNDSLQLFITSLNSIATLKFINDTANGFFTQRGYHLPIVFIRTNNLINKPKRPQEPTYPLPYEEENVTVITRDSINLAGTLTYQVASKKMPAILLIPGSGPSDRDQNIFGHKNFLVLSDYLTRQGFIVLRMDDRGVGESKGSYSKASTSVLAEDAADALKYLRERNEVAADNIGVIGHSQGADIAMLLQQKTNLANFIILLSGSYESLSENILYQTQAIYKKNGATEKAININNLILTKVFEIAKNYNDSLNAILKLEAILNEMNDSVKTLQEKDRKTVELKYPLKKEDYLTFFKTSMRFDLFFEPGKEVHIVEIPTLIIHGKNDIQVHAKNAQLIYESLLKGKSNSLNEIRVIENSNHMLQKCNSCTIDEYNDIELSIDPEVLIIMNKWIKRVLKHLNN